LDQYSYIMHTPDLMRIIEHPGLLLCIFADDTLVYSRCSLSGMDGLAVRVSACTGEIMNWIWLNRLQLNADKTELIRCATQEGLPLLPVTLIRVGPDIITSSRT